MNNQMEKKEEMCEGACGTCGMCEGCEQCGQYSDCGGYHGCGMECRQMYGMGCAGRHHLVRWILGVVILVIVFIAGVKVGAFKESMRNDGYGSRMMDRGYGMVQKGGMMQRNGADFDALYRYGMMQGAEAPKQATPAR